MANSSSPEGVAAIDHTQRYCGGTPLTPPQTTLPLPKRWTEITKTKDLMQGLWVGDRLPTMQQISIASFLANGHEFHLYTYSKLSSVPEGTVIRDAAEIIPRSQVFRNAEANTFAAFSDFFRYKLLLDRGSWWVDLDMVCLRPFLFDSEYVFSSELDRGRERTNSGVIKAPMGSELMAYTWDVCQKKDKQNLTWDEVGPDLMEQAVKRFGLYRHVQPANTFCALPSDLWYAVLQPKRCFRFEANTFSIHLWHELWRQNNFSVDAQYDPGCLYEQFKTKFLLQNTIDPRHNVYQVM